MRPNHTLSCYDNSSQHTLGQLSTPHDDGPWVCWTKTMERRHETYLTRESAGHVALTDKKNLNIPAVSSFYCDTFFWLIFSNHCNIHVAHCAQIQLQALLCLRFPTHGSRGVLTLKKNKKKNRMGSRPPLVTLTWCFAERRSLISCHHQLPWFTVTCQPVAKKTFRVFWPRGRLKQPPVSGRRVNLWQRVTGWVQGV